MHEVDCFIRKWSRAELVTLPMLAESMAEPEVTSSSPASLRLSLNAFNMVSTLRNRVSQSILTTQQPPVESVNLPQYAKNHIRILRRTPFRRNTPCLRPLPTTACIQTERRSALLVVSQQRTAQPLARDSDSTRGLYCHYQQQISRSSFTRLFTTTTTTMASSSSADQADRDYMAFLEKANEDPAKGLATTNTNKKKKEEGGQSFRTTEEGVEVPESLVRVCGGKGVFYVSDADEPFEAVALRWDESGKGLPDEEEFAGLIGHWDPANAEVDIMDPVDWDRNGQYNEIVDAVREAGQGNDVRVYRVTRKGVKAEYWVVTTEGQGKGAKLVGAKALAVES
ncbi:hypothetical protein N657DRAFT_648648 [Parathielavia appendiculata]|uniref:Uncharacterized protein n=1 Tax=Parathielavia appendiculata TaxID=2587402 RepID=A0AAN6TVA5_9PEZI|nr:hypothetical protein N657DRAFT_648648 [Parathielavia appendiculata]